MLVMTEAALGKRAAQTQRLALKAHLWRDLRTTPTRDWIEATVKLCETLAAARQRYRNNAEFGERLDAHGFGSDVIGNTDRSVCIRMGRHPQRLRRVLEKTERQSLQGIYQFEFRRSR